MAIYNSLTLTGAYHAMPYRDLPLASIGYYPDSASNGKVAAGGVYSPDHQHPQLQHRQIGKPCLGDRPNKILLWDSQRVWALRARSYDISQFITVTRIET